VPEPAPEAAAEAETPAPVIASEIASEPEPAPSPAPKAEPPASEEPETLPLPEPAGEPEMDVAAVEPASPVPAAPEPVTEAASNPQVDDREYQTQLRQYMRAALKSVFSEVRYPQRAVDKGIEGQVELLARVKLNGELEEVIMGKPSGYSMLDRAATDAVEKAAPFPALTATAQEEFRMENGEGYELLIPVYFRLRGPSS
jgi:protein TonB